MAKGVLRKDAAGVVYCITNHVNGKRYIGITSRSIEKRFAEHCKADSYIGKAIRKHGVENFSMFEIDYASSISELYEKEMLWIEQYKTFDDGYNLTLGGEGIRTFKKIEADYSSLQKQFIRNVELENEKPVDVSDSKAVVRMTLRNMIYLYLIADYEGVKRQSAKLIYKLKDVFKKQIFESELLDEEEVNRYALK